MNLGPLSGVVTKVPLFVVPAFAQSKELLYFIKCRLYEAGFVIVREEYRLLNAELAECLCVKLDYIPEYVKIASGQPYEAANDYTDAKAATPTSCSFSPSKMVGMAYVYVLAHRDCHAKLLRFISELDTGSASSMACADDDVEGEQKGSSYEAYAELLKLTARSSQEEGEESGALPQALWMNTTSAGAKQAVRLLFPRMLSEEVPTGVQSREFVHEQLKRSLLPALSDLVKTKPAEPIRWLAERLLETNTETPPMIPSEDQ
ncbi:unnamed protein product [Phytomonas sp. EM1]|nr:unnamed protein product [Phytomonas sp. EM1]|eukprot:CCW61841.1 unnamed protein product [Phytomonas sp. isolate EM1]